MTEDELKAIEGQCRISKRYVAVGDVLALVAEVRRLRQAIETHADSTHECARCGHSESCAADDVCLVLTPDGDV